MTNGESPESLRPLLFSIAYRMLGSVADAEDIVQEAFLRHHRALADGVKIESDKAYLSAIVTRLSIDQLRSARVRREQYVGEWLPEPLLTDSSSDPAGATEQADTLSMAFLLLLERLTPAERAVFLLHDVFDYEYDEIARIVGKREENCRQLAARARRHVTDQTPRHAASRREREELAARFFGAIARGDLDSLVQLLASEVAVHGDSGGMSPSWPRPIVGADRVGKLLIGLGRQMDAFHVALQTVEVNGQPGMLVRDSEGRLINVFVLEIGDGRVQVVRSIINPNKLRHLGPLADVRAVLQEGRKLGRNALE